MAESAESLHRPDADDRSYRIVDLPNDLRVLLISDPRISAPKEPPARTERGFFSAIAGPRRTSRLSVAGSDSTAQTAQRCMHARPIDGARTSS